jgi:hypothetical protein
VLTFAYILKARIDVTCAGVTATAAETRTPGPVRSAQGGAGAPNLQRYLEIRPLRLASSTVVR